MIEYKIIHEKDMKTDKDWFLPVYRQHDSLIFFYLIADCFPVVTKSSFGGEYRWNRNVAFSTFEAAKAAIKEHYLKNISVSSEVEYVEKSKTERTDDGERTW